MNNTKRLFLIVPKGTSDVQVAQEVQLANDCGYEVIDSRSFIKGDNLCEEQNIALITMAKSDSYSCSGVGVEQDGAAHTLLMMAKLLHKNYFDFDKHAVSNQYKWVYLIGPITGYTLDNRGAFEDAKRKLVSMGVPNVKIPHELFDHVDTTKWEHIDYCRHSISWMLANANTVVTLPEWHESKGAKMEVDAWRSLGNEPVFFIKFLSDVEPKLSTQEVASEINNL